jgi:hypothetical protein
MKLILSLILMSMTLQAYASSKAYKDCLDWFKLIDEKKYEQSWVEADSFFQNTIKKKSWIEVINTTMLPFGKNIHRKMIKETKHTSLPGTSIGEFIIFQFKSRYKLKRKAIETITFKKGKYNVWRLVGFYIK